MALRAVAPVQPLLSFGPKVATLGTSISFRNNNGSAIINNAAGYMTWLNILSGQRFRFSYANNFGVAGDRIDQVSARTNSVISAGVDMCIVECGSNDITQAISLATMKTNMVNILQPLCAAGIFTVVFPIFPRSTNSGGTTTSTAQKQQIAAFNSFLSDLSAARPDLLSSLGWTPRTLPLFVDPRPYLMDTANSTGDPLAGMVLDGIHPTEKGAFYMGKALNDILSQFLPIRPQDFNEALGVYDATNNVGGNRLFSGTSNYGLLQGTGGTLVANAGTTPTGSIANAMRAARLTSGSTTSTLVMAKENPRTDRNYLSGERQRATITTSGTGGVLDEQYNILYTSGISTTEVAGDMVVSEINYEVVGTPTKVLALELQLQESGGSNQVAADGFYDSSLTGTHVGFTIAHKGTLRTPPMTMTGTSLTSVFRAHMDSSSNTGSLDLYASDFVRRKLV